MNIQIKQLTLQNFKCFRSKEITFNSDITTIKGRNGAGKTTIADAILWCLFGKNTQGQSDFDIKTHDADGKPIPNLDHSVEIELNVLNEKQLPNEGMIKNSLITSDYNITLKRTLKETWIKKRGSDEQVFKNNTTEYMVNGEAKTAADYKKYIAQLVDEEVFKAITNPQYFPSLKWQVQREFLKKMAGEISDMDVYKLDETLSILSSDITDDIIGYLKHLSYQKKEIKVKLDRIPVRLEEQNKALPEKLDWDAIQKEYDNKAAELKAIDEKILSIKSGNGQDLAKEDKRKALDDMYVIKRKLEDACRTRELVAKQELNNQIIEMSGKFNMLVGTQRDLENQIQSFDTLKQRCNETLEKCESDAVKIREQWKENESKTSPVWSEEDSVCPTCGQYLPHDQLHEKKQRALELFNTRKAEVKKELTKWADNVKSIRNDAQNQIKDFDTKKEEAEKNLAETKEQINTVFADKQKLEKEKASLPTFEQMLADDKDYQDISQKIELCKQEIDNASVNSDEEKNQLTELEAKKHQYEAELSNCQSQLASRTQYDKGLSLIEGINEEQKNLVKQLSELERKEDVARRYQDKQNEILEDRINKHFSLVKWKMFRTVNNGGDPFDEPYCECYVDGVAYHDGLNQAARLNAGLDVINALCKHYNVSAPIVLDNAESTINIIETVGQQIRLFVEDTEFQLV